MSQSLAQIYVHIIFHIKSSSPEILPEHNDELYAYIGGVIKKSDCKPIQIGGYKDHLHVFCTLSKNVLLTKLVENIKRNSSRWIKGKSSHYAEFSWQTGYGVFSVSPSLYENVRKYILNQQVHHQTHSYSDEYILFLKRYGVDYDERYLFTD